MVVGHHQLPPPIVADLNGDGHLEMIVATPDLKIQVVQPRAAGKHGEGFAKAHIISEVSLLYKRVVISVGRRPVAMAVGYLDPLPQERVRPPRKQVVVVLTAQWQVLCFDHNLKLLWEKNVKHKFPHHSHIKEASIFVSPHQVRVGDRGLVVVGASMERGDLASGEGLEAEGGDGRPALVFDDEDVLKAEMRLEQEARERARSARATDKLEDLDAGDPLSGLDASRHFSYYAFEGGSGDERWHHSGADFHKDLEDLAGELRPQNDFRLDAEKLEGRHFGEASCRDYRESVLHVLPHSWTSPRDTRLAEAHFIKHKHGQGAQKAGLAARGKHQAHTKTTRTISKAPPAQHHGGILSSMFGARHLRQDQHAGGPHAAPPHHARQHNKHWQHHNFTANALVAYLEEGMEVVHLFSGRTVCRLHLPPGVLHADVNGDGVVDHIQVYHGATAEGQDVDSDANIHHPGSHCSAVAMSGIPPRERLFEINICRTNKFISKVGTNAVFSHATASSTPTEFTTPVLLPIPQLSHGYRSHRAQHGLLVFASNKGEVAAYNARGLHMWQNYYPTTWPHSSTVDSDEQRVVPTLRALPLHRHAMPTTILAAGANSAVILSEHGHLLDTLWLPHPPNQPLVVTDFNGDGLNDIVLVSAHGIYGYAQVQHMGGFTLSALLAT
eukprot:CAMPEP_0202890806 /NCGR_PEP_ID=MMETSP1392-20130828/1099_1 /ASSEMBLY_ACC=CAM_ASM_000868 /TAXON_ID=225041 /ORGANISM="Chlamydomonas chlamydogama, Strain SAG 11-48b" /LENGTH=667 /DNA_ID=CAMNT_0049574447 /DNA_START=241 /DNA_END=2241 /DNA_ORIENTATION=+